jgi:hypothetical protein
MNDYNDKHENIEGFSRSVVGSLFSEDAPKDNPAAEVHDMRPPPHNEDDNEGDLDNPPSWDLFLDEVPPKASRKPAPYKRHGKEPDPEALHEAYLSSASESIRRQLKKDEDEKEAALKHKDRQWEELSKISRKAARADARARAKSDDARWGEKEEPWEPMTNPKAPGKNPLPPINVRNVASLGLFAVLIIFGLLVWQNVAVNNSLAIADAEIERLKEQLVELDELLALRASNEVLEDENELMRDEIIRLNAYVEELMNNESINAPSGSNQAQGGSNQGQTGTDSGPVHVPHTSRDEEGRLIYIVQPADTLWRIAGLFRQDPAQINAKVAALRAANGIVGDNIIAGTPIIIPE